MIVCNVQLESTLEAKDYQRIAETELERLLRSPTSAPDGDLPLYEAHFEFLIAKPGDGSFHRIATVRFPLLSPESPPRVTLFPPLF